MAGSGPCPSGMLTHAPASCRGGCVATSPRCCTAIRAGMHVRKGLRASRRVEFRKHRGGPIRHRHRRLRPSCLTCADSQRAMLKPAGARKVKQLAPPPPTDGLGLGEALNRKFSKVNAPLDDTTNDTFSSLLRQVPLYTSTATELTRPRPAPWHSSTRCALAHANTHPVPLLSFAHPMTLLASNSEAPDAVLAGECEESRPGR